MSQSTHLIVIDGTILETELGNSYGDALDFIWSGDGPKPREPEGWHVYAIDFQAGLISACNDVTDMVARDLCRRTHDRQDTPKHLGSWLEWSGLKPYRERETWPVRVREREVVG